MLLGLSFETQGEGVKNKSYGMNVRCADLLPMLLPKGLVVQEEKMKTVIQNAWDENLKLNALTRVKTQGNAETSD